jgi:DNA polymerase-3 subunit gamma/tau
MLAFRPGSGEGASASGVAAPARSTAAPAGSSTASGAASGAGAGAGAGTSAGAAAAAAARSGPRAALEDWSTTLSQLEVGGAARQLASHCAYRGREGATLRLALDPAQQTLRTPALVEKLSQALSRHLGETVRVEIELAQAAPDTPARAVERDAEAKLDAARRSLDEDPAVRAFRDKFGATVKPDSIRPN